VDSGGVCTEVTPYLPLWTRGNSAYAAHMYGMNIDWLFRGFDSINTGYNPSSSPNVYMNFASSGGSVVSEIPRLAIARNTSNWSAPAARQSGVNLERIIQSQVAFTFAAATGANSYSNPKVQFRMASTAQSFDDRIYEFQMLNTTLAIAVGDIFTFSAGGVEIVLN